MQERIQVQNEVVTQAELSEDVRPSEVVINRIWQQSFLFTVGNFA